jgi:hypothetical protein
MLICYLLIRWWVAEAAPRDGDSAASITLGGYVVRVGA